MSASSNPFDWIVAVFGAAALMAAVAFLASIAIDFAQKRRLSWASAVFSIAALVVMFLGWWDQEQARMERKTDQQQIDQLTSNLAEARREQSETRATLEGEVEAATRERELAQARAERLELEMSETRTTLEGEVEAATRERELAEARADAANSESDRLRGMLGNVMQSVDRNQALSEESLRSARGAQAESARQREFAEAQAYCARAPMVMNGGKPTYGRYVCNCSEAVLPDQVTNFCTNSSGWGSSGGWGWND